MASAQLFSYSLCRLLALVQKAHHKSSNIPRLEAAVKVYASLSRIPSLRAECIKKLTSMLLHPYPKVSRSDGSTIDEIKEQYAERR